MPLCCLTSSVVCLYFYYLALLLLSSFYVFFFSKQNTAYDLRISDGSSDVCSSDLAARARLQQCPRLRLHQRRAVERQAQCPPAHRRILLLLILRPEIRQRLVAADIERAEHDQLAVRGVEHCLVEPLRSEEHTSELQSLMRISYAVFCLKKTHNTYTH